MRLQKISVGIYFPYKRNFTVFFSDLRRGALITSAPILRCCAAPSAPSAPAAWSTEARGSRSSQLRANMSGNSFVGNMPAVERPFFAGAMRIESTDNSAVDLLRGPRGQCLRICSLPLRSPVVKPAGSDPPSPSPIALIKWLWSQ
jgi:hypothetical protein